MANREAIREWVSDLRSGKFQQVRRELHNENGYCCLGVACETFRRVTGRGEWRKTLVAPDEEHIGFEVSVGEAPAWDILPVDVQEWLGTDFNPNLRLDGGEWQPAAVLNDHRGFDFAAIADAVEATYLAEPAS